MLYATLLMQCIWRQTCITSATVFYLVLSEVLSSCLSALRMACFARLCSRNVWLDSQHCSVASLIEMFVDIERCNDWLTSVHMALYTGFFRSDTSWWRWIQNVQHREYRGPAPPVMMLLNQAVFTLSTIVLSNCSPIPSPPLITLVMSFRAQARMHM